MREVLVGRDIVADSEPIDDINGVRCCGDVSRVSMLFVVSEISQKSMVPNYLLTA